MCVCTDRMEGIMSASSWIAYPKWADSYCRFPAWDFDKYFSTQVLPDSASDKLAADRGSTSPKLPFANKVCGKMEEVIRKMDSASRFGMRTSSFLLLLSGYLTLAGYEDSAVPADLMVAALHCLESGLRTVLDQDGSAASTARYTVMETRAGFLPIYRSATAIPSVTL